MDMKMGIDRVVVINDDATESGGAAAIALEAARLLRARRVPVTYLSGGSAAAPAALPLDADREMLGGRHILDGSRAAAALRGLYDPATRAALARWIDSHDTPGTVYHLHNWHKVLSPSIFMPLRQVASRLVISAHDYFLTCPNGGYFVYTRGAPCDLQPGGARCIGTACDRRHYGHKLWRVLRHHVRQRLFDLPASGATVLTVHEKLVPDFTAAGIPHRNVRALRNPVTPWRNIRVPAEENRDVFFVGRLDEDKGVDLLARAASRVGARLHAIGDGPLAASLRAAFPHIRLHGWRTREQIAALIAGARMVVLPTRCRETFGLAALEALTSGIPVIVSRFAAIADEVAASGFGAVCDPYDEDALAATIARLRDDDRLIESMSRRAFAGARDMAPPPPQWCDELLRLYGERLGHEPIAGSAAEPALRGVS